MPGCRKAQGSPHPEEFADHRPVRGIFTEDRCSAIFVAHTNTSAWPSAQRFLDDGRPTLAARLAPCVTAGATRRAGMVAVRGARHGRFEANADERVSKSAGLDKMRECVGRKTS